MFYKRVKSWAYIPPQNLVSHVENKYVRSSYAPISYACTYAYTFWLSGRFAASLFVRASDLPSSLSSPVINSLAYEWKCLRFWYIIGSTRGHDWHTASLMVLLRQKTSNQTVLLFFVDEVTNKAQYTQIPLPSNYTNVQVFI